MGALNGVMLLARFRAEGFGYFLATPQGFLNSLAPLVAVALVAGVQPLLAGSPRSFVVHVLTSTVALLAPPAISHLMARVWQREEAWLRYAVAFNWCQAAITLVTVVLMLITAASEPSQTLATMLGVVGGILCYWLVLCWFMVWRGLGVSGAMAVLGVIGINVGTGLLVIVPQMIAVGIR